MEQNSLPSPCNNGDGKERVVVGNRWWCVSGGLRADLNDTQSVSIVDFHTVFVRGFRSVPIIWNNHCAVTCMFMLNCNLLKRSSSRA